MTLVIIHAAVYLAVNALLVLLWLLMGGELASLRTPIEAVRADGFWPMWVIAFWGVLLAFHAVLATIVTQRRRRHRARRRRGRAAETPPTRWITAMFTDIVGSTALNRELGDEAYSRLLAAHRTTVRSAVSAHGGVEVGTQGDGFLVRFDGAAAALDCAVELQRRLAAERKDGQAPHLRIGLHAGEVVSQDGDVVGQMVNLAARVADEAGPDEVLVTEPVVDHAPPTLEFEDRGLQPLRGVRAPRHVLALQWTAD